MKKYTLVFPLIICFLLTGEILAQDKHFTQFYAHPLSLNPALTGQMSGKYRMSFLYRNQWQTALDFPYKTVSASFDMNFFLGLKELDKVGIGFVFFSDRAGINAFVTNHISVSGAFHKALNFRKTQYLSGGLQIGLVQRSVNYENITFNDQFDGEGGYTFATSEDLPANNLGFFDLSSGVYWTAVPEENFSVHFGVGVHHINFPDVAFDEDEIDRLDPNFSFHAGTQFPISRKVDLLPRAVVYLQGPSMELNIGTNFKVLLNQYNGNSFHIGTWLRPVKDVETSLNLDAVVLLLAIEVEKMRFGVSFDSNVSNLRSSTSGFGAFELSIAYTGKDDSRVVLCPTF